MKKVFLVALIALTAIINTNGQGRALIMTGSDANTDTITNAGTPTLTSPYLGAYTGSSFSITHYGTAVSGTNTYKVVLRGSNDGVNFEPVYKVAGTDGKNCDTLQVTAGVPAVHTWAVNVGAVRSVTDSTLLYTSCTKYLYYQEYCIGTGTQVTIVAGKILPIK